MTLLVTPAELDARRAAAAAPLRPLATSLARELEPLLERDVFIPEEKALLSRIGGRCPSDGSLLDFDPWSPRVHRCPVCGSSYDDELHYRFWIYWYQLWLAERVVHAAVLSTLGVDDRFAAFARAILGRYAHSYLSYPNRDNVLGPTRLFFSTYLESIWLLQVCVAMDLLEQGGMADPALGDRVRACVIEPAREIIASYDEGQSNRQVWNNAALLASSLLLGDGAAAEQAVFGGSGVASHLGAALLSDGTWYEGENYHLFAHRGLWYGVTMAERSGLEVPPTLAARFDEGFATPLLTALPDLTLPARRDSQYGISLRQWRIAEHLELGLGRRHDARLIGALARLYGDDVRREDTGRARSAADVERNARPSALSREDLSWRALLHARPDLPPLERLPTDSALLDAQGIAVFRRDATYAALDYGHSGGGHGHPDRLNVLLANGPTRWLDDMGTGSYVDVSLHWYRSTLAHNAPLVNGRSQARVNGRLLAHEEQRPFGWVSAAADEIGPATSVARTLVVTPHYAVDELRWRADKRVTVDLPLHVDARVVSGAAAAGAGMPYGSDGMEDGFRFLHDAVREQSRAGAVVHLVAGADSADRRLRAWATSDCDADWWRADAPGAPGAGEHAFRILRATADSGMHRIVWCWSDNIESASFEGDTIAVLHRDGTREIHSRAVEGWRIEQRHDAKSRVIELRGLVDAAPDAEDLSVADVAAAMPAVLVRGEPWTADLGEDHYRRSEESWREARRPEAVVSLEWTGEWLRLRVVVASSELTFVAADAVNAYDNEPADINGDGIQLYLFTPGDLAGWMLVPEANGTTVRIRPIDGWKSDRPISASWRPVADGYELTVELPMSGGMGAGPAQIDLDVIVNEKPRGRVRRRGQLVLSGGREEFVYLRGDRHEPGRLLSFVLSNG